MNKLILLLALLLFFPTSSIMAQGENFILKSEKIYDKSVRSFVVNDEGIVYFIGSEGSMDEWYLFSYFEGELNKIINLPNDYSIDNIVLADSDKYIWFNSGNIDIDFIIYDFTNFDILNLGVEGVKIRDLEVYKNNVYITTSDGLMRYDYHDLHIFSKEDVQSSSINFLNMNVDDDKLFFHDFFNAYIYDGNIFTKVSHDLRGASVYFHNNNMWLYSPTFIEGVHRYSLNTGNIEKFENEDIFKKNEAEKINKGQCVDDTCWFLNHAHTNLLFFRDKWEGPFLLDLDNGFKTFEFISKETAYLLNNMQLYKKTFNLNLGTAKQPTQVDTAKRTIIKNQTMYNNLRGRILLQVESVGEAYYVHPSKSEKHFLGRPDDAFLVMREQGIGISNENLAKIPVSLDHLSGLDSSGDGLPDAFKEALGLDINRTDSDGDGYDDFTELLHGYDPLGPGKLNHDLSFAKSQAGRILLQVEKNGEAWYVSPENNKRYFLGRPNDAFNIMRNLGLGISNNDFNKLN